MNSLKALLLLSTVGIYVVTALAISSGGWNWPAVYFGDVAALSWRSQFNVDFLVHLALLASWIFWREGSNLRGFAFGFLSVFLGGMFGFPYILSAVYRAKGDPRRVLLGSHA